MKARDQFYKAYGIRLTRRKHFELLMLLLCLELIVALSYLGFISIPPISVTTLHILVITAALFFGPWESAAVALVFGATSVWKASVTSTEIGDIAFSPALSGKPLESLIMAIGTRIAFALITGLLFRLFFRKERKHRRLGIASITVLATIIHSALVYACMVAFFDANAVETGAGFGRSLLINNLILYLITVILVLGFDGIMRRRGVKEFFELTSEDGLTLSTGQNRFALMLSVLIVLCCVFISLHFLSRLDWYFRARGTDFVTAYGSWIYGLIYQFIAAFAATFIVLTVAFRWSREYFSAQTLRANRKARENAEIANRSKSEFLFNMSHDIRTPMNAITGFTNMAIKHIDEREKTADCLQKMLKAETMLTSLIDSVLEVSRIESGHAKLEEQPGDVLYSFVNIESTMRELAETKDIDLSFSFGTVTDRFVYADFSRCMRIFVNVISNAIKYTPEGGKVRVTCEQLGKAENGRAAYVYTVKDNGIGMSEEFQKHIFEQFSRENNATVSGIQGSGLGMSVVKSFTELMGGTVSVFSKQGEGSVFTITLPFRLQTGELYTDPQSGEVLPGSVRPQPAAQTDFRGKTVLLVEDNELNREIATEILEEEGLTVEDAEDGTVAVERLKEKGPAFYDFILMDIQMPHMNGYEAAKAIREMYPDARLPIIALSANAFAEDKEKSIASGMNDHVAKPINTQELFGVLAKHID